jgi:hypothetical protein
VKGEKLQNLFTSLFTLHSSHFTLQNLPFRKDVFDDPFPFLVGNPLCYNIYFWTAENYPGEIIQVMNIFYKKIGIS